ncbi:MAG: Rpn family recombination-promoting nuclease/putative transposase [Microscillaceae bacterium]|nr:Rpn family recombination-promoting nuclease/putative transposase [Microscillaceae bacterium]
MAIKRLIRFDWAMKKLLRNKANFEILEGFLSELLFEDIKIVKILESEGNQENALDKYNRVDILIENSKEELIIVEVQNDTELDYFQRILFGTSKLLMEYLDLGEEYAKLKKVISISIVYFDLGLGEDYIYHGKTSFYGLRRHDQLTLNARQKTYLQKETVESVFPEYYLIKPQSFDNQLRDSLDEWIYFFKNSDTPETITAKGLAKAKQVLDVMQLPKAEQKKYQRYLEDMSYQKSITETIKFEVKEEAERIKNMIMEQGARKREREIALSLLKNQVPLEIIMNSTGLSLEEIEELRKELGA